VRGTGDLVAVGNALVDLVAVVDGDSASTLGLTAGTAVHVDYARFSEIAVALPSPSASAGGGAANVAKIAALLGVGSAFIGCVGSKAKGGSDRFARLFETDLRRAGVATHLAKSALPTGACAILRSRGGEAAIAACPSAALELVAAHLDEALIGEAKVLVVDGFILPRKALVDRAFDLADRHGTVVALDVGSVSVASAFAMTIRELAARQPLILFLNEAEAEAFARASSGDSAAADDGEGERFWELKRLAEEGSFPVVVVKRGHRGAVVFAGGATFEAPTLFALPYDDTGAGDAFAAGFLAAWIMDRPLAECAGFGNRIARETLSVPGTRLDEKRLRKIGASRLPRNPQA
jgi:fructokinase